MYRIKEVINPIIRHQHFTWQRNVLLGGGMAYAITNSKYWHIPVAVFFPSAYVGYQAFKARDQVRDFIIGGNSNERVQS